MPHPYQAQDSDAWLRKASPIERTRRAVVTHRGKQVARLFDMPGEDLRKRAERFASAVGYHGASIRYGAE